MPTHYIELLEHRIAPAAVFVNPLIGTYTDEDGDLVSVRFSKPILTATNIASILPTTASGAGDHLDKIDLSGFFKAAGTNITVKARIAGDGDGLMNIGVLDATGIDLGIVNIHGDIGTLLAGDTATNTFGLRSLTLVSMGVADTLAGVTPAVSTVRGAIGAVIVATDFAGANLQVEASAVADARIGSVFVGGSVVAGPGAFGGNIVAGGNIGSILVRGSVFGNKQSSGLLGSNGGSVSSVTIVGSLRGGSEIDSGSVFGATIGTVKIGRNLVGGDGERSGTVGAGTRIGALTVGGSLVGGSGDSSARIASSGSIGSIRIIGDVFGGGGQFSGHVDSASGIGAISIGGSLFGGTASDSGSIVSSGNLGAVVIGGNLSGGGSDNTIAGTGTIWSVGGSIASVRIGGDALSAFGSFNGSILAGRTIGPISIGGEIRSYGDSFFVIRATGLPAGGNAIASLSVAGSVASTLVLAGYGAGDVAENGNASIGPVNVLGSWFNSSIVAGVENAGAPFFGTAGDAIVAGSTVVSRIASIHIGGIVRGTIGGTDHYGFVAQQIGSVTIAGNAIPLFPAAHADNRSLGLTGDFRIHEV